MKVQVMTFHKMNFVLDKTLGLYIDDWNLTESEHVIGMIEQNINKKEKKGGERNEVKLKTNLTDDRLGRVIEELRTPSAEPFGWWFLRWIIFCGHSLMWMMFFLTFLELSLSLMLRFFLSLNRKKRVWTRWSEVWQNAQLDAFSVMFLHSSPLAKEKERKNHI